MARQAAGPSPKAGSNRKPRQALTQVAPSKGKRPLSRGSPAADQPSVRIQPDPKDPPQPEGQRSSPGSSRSQSKYGSPATLLPRTRAPNHKSQPFYRGYGSILPTSLTHFNLKLEAFNLENLMRL